MKNKLNKILSTKLKNYMLYLDTKYYTKINFDFFLPQASADRVILRLENCSLPLIESPILNKKVVIIKKGKTVSIVRR